MKKIFTFTIILLALIACTVAVRAIIGYFSVTQATSDSAATDIPQAGIPNPASVYCKEQGNKHEIRMAADGSQSGICVFPDGSAPVTSGPISGESVAPQHKKAQHLPRPLRRPQMPVVEVREEAVVTL